MNWTRERPIEPGWYWVKECRVNPGAPHLVSVALGTARGDRVYYSGSDSSDRLEDLAIYDAWWMGPLPVPAPPTAKSCTWCAGRRVLAHADDPRQLETCSRCQGSGEEPALIRELGEGR